MIKTRRKNMNQEEMSVFTPDTIPTVLMSSMADSGAVGILHHRAYLPSALDDYQPLVPLLDTLYQAGSGDTISLILNGDGGMVSTASHISTGIERSEAVIVTEAYGRISSAHSLVYLCGDVIIPVRNTIAMYHNMAMGTGGSGTDPIHHVAASLQWCHTLFEQYLLPFLTTKEIDSIIENNATIWLPEEQNINDRVFTTMWYRASMGILKPAASVMFADFLKQGVYTGYQLVNLDTILEGLGELTHEEEETLVDTWNFWHKQGLYGDHNNPLDYLNSLM